MKAASYQHFECLLSLNLEGISSPEEDLELWRILKENPEYKAEFFAVRNTHYLLNLLCNDTASETAFANRVKNALHPDRLGDKDFAAAVQSALDHPPPEKKSPTHTKSSF